jgi:hypothetical protein
VECLGWSGHFFAEQDEIPIHRCTTLAKSIYLYGMFRPAFSLIPVLAALAFSLSGHAQNAASMTPNELAAVAVDHLKAEAEEATHYASTSDFEEDIYDAADKRISRFTSHAEFVTLNGEAYERSAIVNGKKLSPSELEAARQSLKKYLLAHAADVEAGLSPRGGSLSDLLTPSYQNRVVGHESIEGRDCILLESIPAVPITNSSGQRGIRLWIDAVNLNVLRSTSQILADYDPGVLSSGRVSSGLILKGTTLTTTYRLFNGVLLPYESDHDVFSRTQGGRFGRVHSVFIHRDYQRFSVTTTIGPATVIETPHP